MSSIKPATTLVFYSFSGNSLVYLIVLFTQKFPLVSVIVVVGLANLSCCCDHCVNVANKPDKNNARQRTPPPDLILLRSHVTSVFQGLSLSLSRSVGRVGENPGNEVAGTPVYYTTEVKLHVKSASFSTDNGQTSRVSIFFLLFLTIKISSKNISITLLQISLKLDNYRGRYWRKKLP